LDAPYRLVKNGKLNYLTLEYLAELTMGILASQKKKNPQLGYVTDFPEVLKSLIPLLKDDPGLKIITNAGGINIDSCVLATAQILVQQGLGEVKIAACGGDDVLSQLENSPSLMSSARHMDTKESLSSLKSELTCANAYLGCGSIVEALGGGARIVITGRVADAALALGPAIFEFNWSFDDYNLLAGGALAGHLIECGAQVTGGLWTGWNELTSRDFINMGYPVAEISSEGSFILCKPENSGGRLNRETVSEQLLYEIGDPSCYITPDVCINMTTVKISEDSENRVVLSGAEGSAPPSDYKVSAAYQNGYIASGQLVVSGPQAVKKAKLCSEIILGRLQRAGVNLKETHSELLGSGDLVPGLSSGQAQEIVLKISARDNSLDKLKRFSREFSPLITSGPPGVTGYTGPRGKPLPNMEFFPFLMSKKLVSPVCNIQSAGKIANMI